MSKTTTNKKQPQWRVFTDGLRGVVDYTYHCPKTRINYSISSLTTGRKKEIILECQIDIATLVYHRTTINDSSPSTYVYRHLDKLSSKLRALTVARLAELAALVEATNISSPLP